MCGLHLEEIDNRERYALKLGSYNPLVVGYDKTKPRPGIDLRYSAHIKILELFANELKDFERFQAWRSQEINSLN